MASVPPPASQLPPGAAPTAPPREKDPDVVWIYSHSMLFYWWPVWAVGLVLAALTYFEGNRAVVVPDGSISRSDATVTYKEGDQTSITRSGADVVIIPDKKQLPRDENNNPVPPKVFMSHQKIYGVVFTFVLVLVIFFTNVPLRGMWSLVMFMGIVLVVVIVWLANWWSAVLGYLDQLDIRLNMGFYMVISAVMLALWLATVFFFDRQIYMKFQPGQLKVVEEVGEGAKVYDTTGMTVEKVRSDFFRHMILGLGSGDLIVRTSGAQAHQFEFKNVLFIGSKVAKIEELMRERQVEPGK